MGRRGRLAIAAIMVPAVVLVTASCSKKVVRSQVETRSASVTEAEARKMEVPRTEAPKAEVPKAPDRTGEKAGRPEEVRPRPDAAAPEAAKWVFVNEHVHFAFGSSLLSEEARRILNGKADYLRANPNVMVTVEGHCDERGTDAYNVALGERRAEAVRTFLVEVGIGTVRLNTVSYGEGRPVAAGHDESSWARNRRAQFAIN